MTSDICCDANQPCPNYWTSFHNSCYFFGNNVPGMTWENAKTFCRLRGSHLVEINDPMEDFFVQTQVRQLYRGVQFTNEDQSFWTGATDLQQTGVWRWSHSNQIMTYTNWLPGEPNNYHDLGEHCLGLFNYEDFSWVDLLCSNLYHVMCEK